MTLFLRIYCGSGTETQAQKAKSDNLALCFYLFFIFWCFCVSVLERTLSAEAVEHQLSVVREMWEMAFIIEFLNTFDKIIQLSQCYPAATLEHAIVTSPGTGMLAQLHLASAT